MATSYGPARLARLVVPMLLLGWVPAAAQQPPRRGLAPSIGFTTMTSSAVTGAAVGLRAGLLGMRPNAIGIDFGIGYLLPSRPFGAVPGHGAAATDLGLTYLVPGEATDLVLGLGGSFLLNSNGSGEAAPHVKLGVLHALSERIGIRADIAGRYWIQRVGFGAGVDVGLVWTQGLPGPRSEAPGQARTKQSFDGWMFGAAANLLALEQQSWDLTFWGPSAMAARVRTGAVGFETALSFIRPTGRYGFTGASLDLGLAYGLPAGAKALVLPRLGVTALVGGDSDGTGGGSAAIYAGAGVLRRLVGPLALRVEVTPRIWLLEETSVTFGGSAGLVLVR